MPGSKAVAPGRGNQKCRNETPQFLAAGSSSLISTRLQPGDERARRRKRFQPFPRLDVTSRPGKPLKRLRSDGRFTPG